MPNVQSCILAISLQHVLLFHRLNYKVVSCLHWKIYKEVGLEISEKYYDHVPQKVINVDDITIMWDVPVFTDLTVPAKNPDIKLHNKREKMCV